MAIKTKVTDKNTAASKKLLQEYERIMKLEESYTQKQLQATQKLETLLLRKQELDAEYVSELDPEKLDKLAKVRRDLRLAIEDEEMLVSMDVSAEIRKHLNLVNEYTNAASKEFDAFKAEANSELDEIEKVYKAAKSEIAALFNVHPYGKAHQLLQRLRDKTRAR